MITYRTIFTVTSFKRKRHTLILRAMRKLMKQLNVKKGKQ